VPDSAEPKNVAVIGCGALGSLFAGLLANAGQQVWAVCRWREHLEAIETHGLRVIEDEKEIRAPVRACAQLPPATLAPEAGWDLVIVLVKAFDTESAAASLVSRLAPGTPVLTLQNGLGNAEALEAHLPQRPIMAGATTFGALRAGPGTVRLTGRGECEIGAWNRAAEMHLKGAAELLSASGIPCCVSPDVRSVLWKKLAVSAVINPLTAILRVRNGELLERSEPLASFKAGLGELAAEVVEEVCQVAAKVQVRVPTPAELLQEVRRICQTTSANRSSMCRDVEEGRRTEIEAINGAVVRLGRERGVAAPANLVLSSLVRASARPGFSV